jgi:CheY-like chemotaxis protein
MLRVLMVLEDYGELMFLQTVLKKMGFDVDAIQNPRSLGEHILQMNPDLLVMTSAGKRVNGIDLNKAIKRVRGNPKVIMMQNSGAPAVQAPNVEGWLTSPVAAADFLNKMAEVCGLNAQVLQEKFQKLKLKEIEDEKSRVLKMPDNKGGPVLEKGDSAESQPADLSANSSGSSASSLAPTSMPESEREERYKKFLDDKIPTKEGFSVRDVQAKIRELRKAEDSQDLEDLERERRAFVEHLFRKKA